MKQNIIIVFFLIVAQIGAFTLKSHAQPIAKSDTWIKTWTDTASYKSVGPELIADETTITYQKNDAKIECDNEDIARTILKRYNQIIKSCVCSYKKYRHDVYRHYTILVCKEDANLIKSWAKSNL